MFHNCKEVAVQKRQYNLGFRVAETAVIFDDLRSVFCNHQTKVKASAESSSLFVHGFHSRQEDFFHAAVVRIRRNGSHTAGIQSLISVQSSLVIHGGYHRNQCLSVCKRKDRNLWTSQKFFDNYFAAAVAENFIFHHISDCLLCSLKGFSDDYAFSECQTVSLYNHWNLTCIQICKSFLHFRKGFISSSRNLILFHQILRKRFAALDNRSFFIRSKARNALCF